MAPIRRNRKRPDQLPHPVRMQAKMADPPNRGPFTLMLENQSQVVLLHTDLQTHKKINQLYGTHHKLDSAEESGGAVMIGKLVPQHASEENSSLQNPQMEDKHRVSEPDRNNMIPARKEMILLQFRNQHDETAAAGNQIKLPAHQKDPKGPRGSSKFHSISFIALNKLWEAFVWDPTKKRGDPRKNPGMAKRRKPTGGQWYLGMYDSQEEAAQIHDKAVIKLGRHKGLEGTLPCPLNFPLSTYASDIEEMKECGGEPTEEYFRRLRASYTVGFVQGKVDMRGVSPKEKSAKYVAGFSYKDSDTNRKLHIYLGSFEDKVEAGKCYNKLRFSTSVKPRARISHTTHTPKRRLRRMGVRLRQNCRKRGVRVDKGIDDLQSIKEVHPH